MLISFLRFKPARLNANSALKLTFRERPGPSIFIHKKTSACTVPENQPLLDLLFFRFVYYAIHTGETDLPQKSCQQVGRKMCCPVHQRNRAKQLLASGKSSPPTTWKKQQGFWAPVMTRETWSWQEVFHMNLISFHKELIKRNSLSSFKNSRMLSTRLPLSLIITE